jgi:hypothetical protein
VVTREPAQALSDSQEGSWGRDDGSDVFKKQQHRERRRRFWARRDCNGPYASMPCDLAAAERASGVMPVGANEGHTSVFSTTSADLTGEG